MGLDGRKPVFRGLRTTHAQSSLRISTVWSAPKVVIRFYENTIYRLATEEISIFLASHYSWGDWFETSFVGKSEDRFSCDKAQIKMKIQTTI